MERTPASIAEVHGLVAAIDERYRAMVLMAAFVGLRWGELIALTRRRLDIELGTVHVSEQVIELKDGTRQLGPPKTEAGVRTVAIPPHIIPQLERHVMRFALARPDGLVFPSPDGEPLCRSNFNRRIFRPAAETAGLGESFRFHDLRHTGNTLAASTGASTRELIADAISQLVEDEG